MRLTDVEEEAWTTRAHPLPTKLVPDFDVLFDDLNVRGWLVLEPPAIDHRITTNDAVESKLVKDFKNWVMNNKRLMLNNKRIGQYRWYLTIGAPRKGKANEDK
jgi:hypothetical protein